MKAKLIMALLIAGTGLPSAAHADGRCVSAGGEPVRSDFADCWRAAAEAPVTAHVLFDFGDAALRQESQAALDDVARRLLAGELRSVAVVGYADRVGGATYNQRLSAQRAAAIRSYLLAKGVPEERMHVEARGESEPVTAERCSSLGAEGKPSAGLIACLAPDRRAEIELAGRD